MRLDCLSLLNACPVRFDLLTGRPGSSSTGRSAPDVVRAGSIQPAPPARPRSAAARVRAGAGPPGRPGPRRPGAPPHRAAPGGPCRTAVPPPPGSRHPAHGRSRGGLAPPAAASPAAPGRAARPHTGPCGSASRASGLPAKVDPDRITASARRRQHESSAQRNEAFGRSHSAASARTPNPVGSGWPRWSWPLPRARARRDGAGRLPATGTAVPA